MQTRPFRLHAMLRFALACSLLFQTAAPAMIAGPSAAGERERLAGAIPQAPDAAADGEELFFFFPRLQVSIERAHRRGRLTPVVFHVGFFNLLFSMDSRGRLFPGEVAAMWRGDSQLRLVEEASQLCLGSRPLSFREISRTASRTRLAVEQTDLVAWLRVNRATRRAALQIGEWRIRLLLVDRPGAAAGVVNLTGPALPGEVSVPLTGAEMGHAPDGRDFPAAVPALFRYPHHRSPGANRRPR